MAVALLERKVNTEVEAEQTIDYRSSYMTAVWLTRAPTRKSSVPTAL